MNLDKDDIEIEEILYRYFRGELSADDQADVERWRNADLANQKLFDEHRVLFLDMKALSFYKSLPQAEDSWDEFKEENSVRSIQSPSMKTTTFLKYAASILVVVSAAFAVYRFQAQPESIAIAQADIVQELVLPDESKIVAREGAKIQYLAPFQNSERRVRLEGGAYFDVSNDPKRPFVIESGEVEVRVLGTKFYLDQEAEDSFTIQVEEGKVLVSYQETHEIIGAGTSVKLDLVTAEVLETVDETGLSTFWKNRRLAFNLTPIQEVVRAVNQAYSAKIQLEGSTEGCALTVVFENESLENVLEVITSTLNYEMVDDQGEYILRGDGCQ